MHAAAVGSDGLPLAQSTARRRRRLRRLVSHLAAHAVSEGAGAAVSDVQAVLRVDAEASEHREAQHCDPDAQVRGNAHDGDLLHLRGRVGGKRAPSLVGVAPTEERSVDLGDLKRLMDPLLGRFLDRCETPLRPHGDLLHFAHRGMFKRHWWTLRGVPQHRCSRPPVASEGLEIASRYAWRAKQAVALELSRTLRFDDLDVASSRKQWLRSGDVRKMTGYSHARIQQLTKSGELPSVMSESGAYLYELADVQAIARRRHVKVDKVQAMIAVEVFELFQAGMKLPDIVIRTCQNPRTIRELWVEFKRPLEHETHAERAERLLREQKELDDRARELDRELESKLRRKAHV